MQDLIPYLKQIVNILQIICFMLGMLTGSVLVKNIFGK